MRNTSRTDLAATGKSIAKRAIAVQAIVTVVIAIIAGLVTDTKIGLSVFFGALISLLPNMVFAIFAFRFSGARHNQQVARSFSQGAKVKLALSIILFVIAFNWLNASPLALFAGFAVATVSHWLALLQQHDRQ
ncbi:ATP synthase subunit I [Salinimonas marina]|uniref:ATP synthase subunit I n=1 Tax=Salinimonas marina TaxID=2785918 RepID=UPI001E2D0E12|nr:ATP synthase subunit I [Salinimonas marina]